MPDEGFWADAGMQQSHFLRVTPSRDHEHFSDMAYDDSVAVLALCGSTARDSTAVDLQFRTDAGPEVDVKQIVANVDTTGRVESTVLILTPPDHQTDRLQAIGSGGATGPDYSVADRAPAPQCPQVEVDSRAIHGRVVACGAWTVLELYGFTEPLSHWRVRDVEVRSASGRLVSGISFIDPDDRAKSRLEVSAALRTGRTYVINVPRVGRIPIQVG